MLFGSRRNSLLRGDLEIMEAEIKRPPPVLVCPAGGIGGRWDCEDEKRISVLVAGASRRWSRPTGLSAVSWGHARS